jgi:hypothetical protein
MTSVVPGYVQQLAGVVRRLKPDELRQLVELVPELRPIPSDRAMREEQAAVAYFRQAASRLPSPEDEFINGLSYADYFALSPSEQDALWDRIFAQDPTGSHDLREHDARPNAHVAARQERRA